MHYVRHVVQINVDQYLFDTKVRLKMLEHMYQVRDDLFNDHD